MDVILQAKWHLVCKIKSRLHLIEMWLESLLLGVSRRAIHRLFTYCFPLEKHLTAPATLPLEHLVKVSIFICIWYYRGSILKQLTGELNIGVRWGQVLHSH